MQIWCSSRPDAKCISLLVLPTRIAIAVRTGSPIFAAPEVIDEAGVEIKDAEEESEIEKFREFLDEVTPEDFAPPPER